MIEQVGPIINAKKMICTGEKNQEKSSPNPKE